MNFDEYRQEARRTHVEHDDAHVHYALGFAEEAGEVAGLVKKRRFLEMDVPREKLVEELGDAAWYFSNLMKELGIEPEEVFAANRDKLRARYPDGFVKGGGIR